MKVVEALTGFIVESVKDIDEGYRVINSCEKEADMYGWERPDLDIIDSNGNSLLDD